MTLLQGSLLFGAAIAAGMINSIAGGGTLLTFPSLVWAGFSPVIANATSTLALVPGAWSSLWGYRRETIQIPRKFLFLLIPSFIGGVIGAVLLKRTPDKVFAALVPFLILFATVLFMIQGTVQRRLKTGQVSTHPATTSWLIGASCYQLLVAAYGGYFGAGIGILMLAVLGMMGLSDIHQMNGLKNLLGSTVNAVAAVYFVYAGLIDWPTAGLMAAGAILGGYGAAGIARKLGQTFVRRAVIVIGIAMAISLFLKH